MNTKNIFAVALFLLLSACAEGATAFGPTETQCNAGTTVTIYVSVDANDFPEGQNLVDISLPLGGQMVYLPSVSLAALNGLANYPLDTCTIDSTDDVQVVSFYDSNSGDLLFYTGFCTQLHNGVVHIYKANSQDIDTIYNNGYDVGYEAGYTAGLAAGGDTTTAYNNGYTAGYQAATTDLSSGYSPTTGLRLRHILSGTKNGVPSSSGLTKVSDGYYTAPLKQQVTIWAILEDKSGNPIAGKNVVESTSSGSTVGDHQNITTSSDPEGFGWIFTATYAVKITYCIYCRSDPTIPPLVFQVEYK